MATIEQVEEDFTLIKKYQNKVHSSRDRKIPFLLTFAQYKRLLSRKTCYYSGVRFGTVPSMKLTLDRIDANIGYTVANTVPCLDVINQAKALFENKDHINIHHLIKAVGKM